MYCKKLTCIGCPMGCEIEVKLEDEKVIEIKGNNCNIGSSYAKKECTHPSRIVTSSLRVTNGESKMVSVKTEKDVPKEKVFECIKALKSIKIEAPLHIGDVVIEDVAKTGVKVVVTKNVEAKGKN
ncbi:DUF1667 domain-containing protein [Haloimpatiens sp. FM7315]|uniref:DUF1667 domain-containing protein n=1 Tax=Haloimpatiens sp. FM7315 TaxID=3298609 RepID=UPI0035A307D5